MYGADCGGAEKLFTLELVLEVVLTEVAFDVAVESVGDELVVGYAGVLGAVEYVFVGGLGVVEVADGLYGGGPAADDADVVDVGLAECCSFQGSFFDFFSSPLLSCTSAYATEWTALL